MPAELHQNFRIDPADLPDEAIIFGNSAAMQAVRGKIECVLDSDFPILLQGESGTGKEWIARFLHMRSSRSEGPFVKLNCSAIAAGLLERELLGCEAGTLPDEDNAKPGLIEIADGGTLLLDEIGDMDWKLQAKLLHFLREGCYSRIGGRDERHANARIICTTNGDLAAAVNHGAFNRDLYYHIDVMCLRLPSLRDRKEDIPHLWEFFTQKLAKRFGKNAPQLTPAVLHVLRQWNWPGNMRELENCIARVIILGDEEGLGADLRRKAAMAGASSSRRQKALKGVSRQIVTYAVVRRALRANHRNQRKTDEGLKRSYRSLPYRLKNPGALWRRKGRKGFPWPSDSQGPESTGGRPGS